MATLTRIRSDKAAVLAARLLWALPARAHDWLARHVGGRPARIVLEAHFDSRGRRHVTHAEYLWEERR